LIRDRLGELLDLFQQAFKRELLVACVCALGFGNKQSALKKLEPLERADVGAPHTGKSLLGVAELLNKLRVVALELRNAQSVCKCSGSGRRRGYR
jgi:hypothetical protein